jgi:hypothetical protein
MACVCKPQPWPFADMSACKWAGTDRKAVDVPSSPAVWMDEEESDDVKEGCERAAGSCNAACGGGRDIAKNARMVSLNSCFQFIGYIVWFM